VAQPAQFAELELKDGSVSRAAQVPDVLVPRTLTEIFRSRPTGAVAESDSQGSLPAKAHLPRQRDLHRLLAAHARVDGAAPSVA